MSNTIAFIAGTYKPERCGVAHYTARLRDNLNQQNIESIVLTTHTAAAEVNDKSVRGVVQDWRFADLMSLVQAVHGTKADILHIQHAAGTYGFERAIFLLPLLLKATGYRQPIVTTVHEYGWWEWQPKGIPPQVIEWLKMWGQQRGWWDREDGFLLTLSDALITTNAEAEEVIYQRLPQLSNRVLRIPIAANVDVATIDKTTARQQLRQRCKFAQDTTVIVFFGFLHPVKGIETLLSAFKQVLITHPQARLLLVGGVESLALRGEEAKLYWEKLHAFVAELDLSEMVHLTGYVDAETASKYLSGSDIGVLPFNHGLTMKSGSLLTLLAHGLPVVGTSHNTPLPEKHPVQLVPPRNINALADALCQLLNQPDKCNYLCDAGRAFIHNFSWSNIARSHIQIYEKFWS
ncbi:glycosyltransferase [Iningainema tapete]|uniref:Glycosyltransferase n=1 Tax=Iningainema tapete BLCC-T55 TaxID=2748662 RepID=A0A8J6XPN0_9CYAN|nr:glycosyltransferase [Iningainema tapete]MBD2777147.1 glycosyltransferase [Iningainema tapete BLCC-T55]